MRESARQKGKLLVYRQYTITAVFFVFLLILKAIQRVLQFDYAVVEVLAAVFCLATFCYYVYEVTHSFTSYFYAYAMGVRERAPAGKVLWPILSIALTIFAFGSCWFLIASFEKNIRAYLDEGTIRLLIATNLVAGLVVIMPSTFGLSLIHI